MHSRHANVPWNYLHFCVVVPFSEKTIFRTSWGIYFFETATKRHFPGVSVDCLVQSRQTDDEVDLLEYRKLMQWNVLNLFLRDTNRSVIDLNSRFSIQKRFYRDANREKSITDRNWNQKRFLSLMPRLVYQIELNKCLFYIQQQLHLRRLKT